MYIKELLYLQLPTLEEKIEKKCFLHLSTANIVPVCIHDRHIVSTVVLQSMQLSALVLQYASDKTMQQICQKAIYS